MEQTLELERKMAREEAKRDMKMYLANDWQLKEETPEYFLLTKNEASTGVHILIAIFFWWLLFVPNVVYHLLKQKKKKIVK